MDRLETLRILSQAADWDAAAPSTRIEQSSCAPLDSAHTKAPSCPASEASRACSSSPPDSAVREDAAYGICRVKRLGGGSVPILKVLLSNACSYNCAYCVNRRSSNVRRASFQPEELARTVSDFDARGRIHGAFISSGVLGTPDETMERLIWTARSLRERYGYLGYLHLKVIPGASPDLVRLAMRYATRVSVNIEMPSEESLVRIAPDKSPDAILSPMSLIAEHMRELQLNKADKPASDSLSTIAASPLTAGQTTQMIVGASPEPDSTILALARHLYQSFNVRRVYYSAFRPEGTDPSLPHPAAPPYTREFRLYQADMLFRWYGFEPDELFEQSEYLDEDLDPKAAWALRHPGLFPVELMTADFLQLVRVPGIGPTAARRILEARKKGGLDFQHLQKMRIRLRNAAWFITLRGKTPFMEAGFDAFLPDDPGFGVFAPGFAVSRALDHPEILREIIKDKKPPVPPTQQELDFLS